MEKNGLVDFFLREGSYLDNALCYDPEIALMTKNELMDVWAWADSWWILVLLESADRSGDLDADNDVIDISVSILFHTWGTGADPTA